VPAVRDVLDRFRPVAAPGAAGRAALPADRALAVAAELEPVFAALTGPLEECARMRHDAALARDGDLAEARAHAETLVATARRDAPGIRAETAAARQAEALAEVRRAADEAAGEADAIRARAARRTPEIVARVVARAAELIEAELAVAEPVRP
jgi:hypothetical protein